MADRPSLSLLGGADWLRAVEAEAAAQETGTLFDLAALEARLHAGDTVMIYDRTNAVFYLGLFAAPVAADLEGLKPLAASPRSMYVLAGLHDLEAKLEGRFEERDGVVLTGAPEEHDGLEYFLANRSATAWLSKEGEQFKITLTGVDYDKLMETHLDRSYDPKKPKPQLQEEFSGPSLKAAYIAAASFGELDRERRYAARGMSASPLRSPVLLPDLAPVGPRSRPSGLAAPEL